MSREPDAATESGVRRRIVQSQPCSPFSLWVWVYLGFTLLGIAATAVVMRQHRETLAERSRAKGTIDWDVVVASLWGFCYFIALPLVAGFDARLGWTSQLASAWHTAGIVLFAAGFALTAYRLVPGIW